MRTCKHRLRCTFECRDIDPDDAIDIEVALPYAALDVVFGDIEMLTITTDTLIIQCCEPQADPTSPSRWRIKILISSIVDNAALQGSALVELYAA